MLWEYFWEKWGLKKVYWPTDSKEGTKPGADVGRCRVGRELRKPWRETLLGKARKSAELMVTVFIRIAPVFKIERKIQMSLPQLACQPSKRKYLKLPLIIQGSS